jgi:hypothetical protein
MIVPCYRSSECNWPACSIDCDGRKNATALQTECTETPFTRQFKKDCEALRDRLSAASSVSQTDGVKS